MRVAFFSAKPYDSQFFDRYNETHEITFIESRLTPPDGQVGGSARSRLCIC